ncbi:XdhC family protein [Tianweitania sp. BSSL-BM11]|uniref:XdhC family protein n=1 Tax=Tianweitania aestuarii TaxID=2814886 RepID=A0ABS5RXA7_9HYPH|nr:XdhC family protein [Tianweitania aestuarii]
MDRALLLALNEERRVRRAAVVVTDLVTGSGRLVRQADVAQDPLDETLREAFRSGQSRQVEVDGCALFLNVHLPSPRLVIIGAVHISQALAPMARIAGFELEVIDPRTAFATPERFAGSTLHADWPEEVLARQPLDAFCALAALTHDPKIDDYPLKAALQAGCFYVGALGSRKTHATRLARLAESGVSEDQLRTIRAPIGLDIGASNPAEIAVAVLGEVIAAMRGRIGVAG